MTEKEKKGGKKSQKKGVGEKAKSKIRDYCVKILLSVHAQTWQANCFASGSEGREVYNL